MAFLSFMMRTPAAVIVCAAVALSPATARTAIPTTIAITPPVQLQPVGDAFANHIAVDGDTMVVAAPASDYEGHSSGGIHVYQKGPRGWRHRGVLLAGDGYGESELGYSVDIQGSTIVAGAARHRAAGYSAGAAFVFQDVSSAGDWSQVRTTFLLPAGAANYDSYGTSVAVEGRTVMVGGPRVESNGVPNAGAVAVFTDTSSAGDWSEVLEGSIRPVAPDSGGRLGTAVDIRGRMAVITAPGMVDTAGRATTYLLRDISAARDWSAFDLIRVVCPPYGQVPPKPEFGLAVCFGDDRTIAFGGIFWYAGGTFLWDVGEAWLFIDESAAGDWSDIRLKQFPTGASALRAGSFGASIVMSGSTVVVGAPRRNMSGITQPGAAMVFEDTSAAGDWSSYDQTEVFAPDAEAYDQFGSAVALTDDEVIVGAPWEDLVDLSTGSLYVLDREPPFDLRQKVTGEKFADTAGISFGQVLSMDDDVIAVAASYDSGSEIQFHRRKGAPTLLNRVVVGRMPQDVVLEGRHAFVGMAYSNDERILRVTDTSSTGDWSSVETEEIVLTIADENAYWGRSLAINGRELLIGSRYSDSQGYSAGAVIVLRDTSPGGDWSAYDEAFLETVSAPVSWSLFSQAMAVRGDTLVIGAPGQNSTIGSVSVFTRDATLPGGWRELTRLTPVTVEDDDGFGCSVAIDDHGQIVVGAEKTVVDGLSRAGATYVLRDLSPGGDWSSILERRFVSAKPIVRGAFGWKVAIDGDRVLIAEPTFGDANTPASPNGVVWALRDISPSRDWSAVSSLPIVASRAAADDHFGYDLAMEGRLVWIGAPRADFQGAWNGTIYRARLPR